MVGFTAPIGLRGDVKVFNLRCELVRTPHSGGPTSAAEVGPGKQGGEVMRRICSLVVASVLALGCGAAHAASYWHVDTFNAENLNDNGAGNHAMWCGVDADEFRGTGYYHVPGYGNNWDESLVYEFEVKDPSQPDTIELEFFFNFDHEPGYGDEFTVEYDLAGTWVEVMRADWFDDPHPYGSNKDISGIFPVPGEKFSDNAQGAIVYTGNDYGASGSTIAIRLRFVSAGAWSDEDGLWPTDAGSVQVDDISISHAGGTWIEDFEGPGPWLFDTVGTAVTAPEVRRVQLSVSPNPLNPATLIEFTAAPGSTGLVEVFNLRGELVRTLHAGEFVTQEFRWEGDDSRGAPVGSGVYLIQATDGTTTQTAKVALVK